MRRIFRILSWVILVLMLLASFLTSCGSSDYKVFSLREGIGYFSMEYPSAYMVTRIDIRNDATSRYTDIGLSSPQVSSHPGLNEISIYAWPSDTGNETATLVLDEMLAKAETIFQDFKLLQRFSVMIGDMEGQGAIFSWSASPTTPANESEAGTLPAVSRIVCFRHGDLAWEIHVASDSAAQTQAAADFQHITDTFQILN
jgi:hypothetical protein